MKLLMCLLGLLLGQLELQAQFHNHIKQLDQHRKYPIDADSTYDMFLEELFQLEGIDTNFLQPRIARFPGGDTALLQYLDDTYNQRINQELKLTGTIYLRVVIDEEGRTRDFEIMRGVHPRLDNELIRVMKESPRWQPAICHYSLLNLEPPASSGRSFWSYYPNLDQIPKEDFKDMYPYQYCRVQVYIPYRLKE